MINPDELFALLLVIVIVAGVVYARRRGTHTDSAQQTEGDRLRDEVCQLRERLQVLERVVIDTHPAVDLDRQIERLRDQ